MNKNLIQTYLTLVIITLGALYIIDTAHIAYPLDITSTTRSTELSVVGEGKVEIVPDTASITVGITVNNASTVEAAESEVNKINNNIIASLKDLGIAAEDIQTSNYSIRPNYGYDDRTQQIDGFNAEASVTIKTQQIDLAPQVVSRATEAGANQVNGISYSVDDPAKFREEARTAAIENAKQQAEKLASELGIKLGKVTNIVESSAGSPEPYFKTSMMAADLSIAESAPAEFEPGTQTVSSTVTLYFEKR